MSATDTDTDTDTETAEPFDYNASADFFAMKSRNGRRRPLSYRHFASAAEAIRYAVEEIPAEELVGALIETEGSRYNSKEIHRLYADASFPLKRSK